MAHVIGKTFSFSAAHALDMLPSTHKCSRLHGHTYAVTVELTAPRLTSAGFVTDFGDLEPFRTYLKEHLDHRFLNEALEVTPTSELLAEYLGGWFISNVEPVIPGQLVAVTVAESSQSWARWEVRR